MIAFVEGTLVEAGPPAVVAVGGGGVGLALQLTTRASAELPAPGERVRFWTHLVAREDGWTLYGFPGRDELALFRLLIGVNGVGPKLALGALSGASAAEIVLYLRTGDEKNLTRLPGIGRKTAARLVVELGERAARELGAVEVANAGGGQRPAGSDPLREAMAVLEAMGLPPARAEQALRAARERDAGAAVDVENWVRRALRAL
ncbi:MAG: Holliday junction branch migration protein RuvA [Candidatus Krumholzibacteriia bacterium]